MPIYEYVCQHCGHQEDILQKMHDAHVTQCPKCHQESFSRLVSAAGFQLKGTGWYVTDFKNKDKKPPESSKNTEISSKTADTPAPAAESQKTKE